MNNDYINGYKVIQAVCFDDGANPGIQKKYNYLAAAEMTGEDNCNQIDGIPNNTTLPTFEERMKDAKEKANEQNSRKSDSYMDERHSKKLTVIKTL